MEAVKTLAIILAAGKGSRMRATLPKQYLDLNGMPMMAYSLKAFEKSSVDDILIVVSKGESSYVKENIIKRYNISKATGMAEGGAERYESVYNALCQEAILQKKYDIVLIHDAARPAVSLEIIEAAIEGAARFKAYVPAVVSKDTVKLADEEGLVEYTPERKRVYCIQTPQAFSYQICKAAYDKLFAAGDFTGITDDAAVVEKMTDVRIKLGYGEYTNIKVTTLEDKIIMESLLNELKR